MPAFAYTPRFDGIFSTGPAVPGRDPLTGQFVSGYEDEEMDSDQGTAVGDIPEHRIDPTFVALHMESQEEAQQRYWGDDNEEDVFFDESAYLESRWAAQDEEIDELRELAVEAGTDLGAFDLWDPSEVTRLIGVWAEAYYDRVVEANDPPLGFGVAYGINRQRSPKSDWNSRFYTDSRRRDKLRGKGHKLSRMTRSRASLRFAFAAV